MPLFKSNFFCLYDEEKCSDLNDFCPRVTFYSALKTRLYLYYLFSYSRGGISCS